MNKFKVGDKVRAISASYTWGRVKTGDVGTVSCNKREDLQVDFPVQSGWFCDEKDLELVEDTSGYHKHHDLIIQWAKGAEIEIKTTFHGWVPIKNPTWASSGEYRIKQPTVPKTDKERIAELEDRVQELENK